MPKLTTIRLAGNDRCLRDVMAHALVLLPNTPHLTGISKARMRSSDIIPLHLPSLKMAPEGLAVAMAQGRLSFLQQLELSPGGPWRFLCDEPHRTLLVNAVLSGALPQLTSLAVDDVISLLYALCMALETRGRLRGPVEADPDDPDDDDDNEDGEGEPEEISGGKGEQRGQLQRRQAMLRKLEANLSKLHLVACDWSPETMTTWTEGVLDSAHLGAALKELQVTPPLPTEGFYAANVVLSNALRDGAFPHLTTLRTRMEWIDTAESFVAAMKDGAPCAHTLQCLNLGSVLPKYVESLRELLPECEIEAVTRPWLSQEKKAYVFVRGREKGWKWRRRDGGGKRKDDFTLEYLKIQ